VIAVTSGKGGVGKTNIVGNLALALIALNQRVLVFDADLGLANIDIIYGVHPKYNIGHVLSGEMALTDIVADGPQGIKIIPAGSGFMSLTHLTEGQKLHILSEFEVLEDAVDVMLIDTGAGISENVIYFNLAAEECLIVATPEPTSNTDAYAMMKVMSVQYGTKHFKLLVNMVKNEREAKKVYLNLCQAVDRFLNGVLLEYQGYLPKDNRISEAVREQVPFLELFPDSPSSKKIRAIAADLIEAPRRTDADGNIKFFLKKFMEFRR
jgi:flagellar biosynthesis protein FlhG